MSTEQLINLETLRNRYVQGESLSYVFFWGPGEPGEGTVVSTCLSQWYPLGFTIDEVYYATAEHWMMACKARLFSDHQILAAILEAATPAKVKKLGRQVRNFDDTIWRANARRFVTEGNYAKFTQHVRLRDFLLSTGDSILVEASPLDKIWGIGLKGDHPDARNPERWLGTNLLGFALMDVREQIKHELKLAKLEEK